MPKLYLVWNPAKNECVGFFDKEDADWTATGRSRPFKTSLGVPTVGANFREQYAEETDDGQLPLTEVEV